MSEPLPIICQRAAFHVARTYHAIDHSRLGGLPHSAERRTATESRCAGGQSAAALDTVSRGQQQAALSQLLVKYTYDQSHDVDAQVLSALGKQITAAAKLLGQHVTLPQAPPGAAAKPAPEADKVDVTA